MMQLGDLGPRRRHPPGFRGLVGVGRPDDVEAGNGAQRRKLLDRLVRRAVLADPDRIVAEHENGRQLHDRGEPDRRAHIVAENQEGRGERPQVGERHAVGDRAHRMLANAEMHVPAALAVSRFEIARALECQPGLRRRREIRRAADQGRYVVRDRVQHLAAGVARRHSRGIRREVRNVMRPTRRAACRRACRRVPSASSGWSAR